MECKYLKWKAEINSIPDVWIEATFGKEVEIVLINVNKKMGVETVNVHGGFFERGFKEVGW